MVTSFKTLYEGRVVWIKLEGGGNIRIARVYAANIPTERMYLWHLMTDSLPKDCKWIIGGDINMIEQREDKSNECGRVINNLERYNWN